MKRLRCLVPVVLLATTVVLAGTPFQSSQLAAAPDPKFKAQTVVLVDANGAEIGPVMDIGESAIVHVPVMVSGVRALLVANSSGVFATVGGNGSGLFFQSADCSGTPIVAISDMMSPSTTIAEPGQTLYVENDGAVRQEYLVGSYVQNLGGCQQAP